MADSKQRSDRTSFFPRLWAWFNGSPLGVQIVGGTIATLSAALIVLAVSGLFNGGDSDHAGQGGEPGEPRAGRPAAPKPKSATEEIATRTFWSDTPQLFSGAEEYFSYEGDGNGPYIGPVVAVDVDGGPRAFDPEELSQAGADLQGLPVVLVGRVVTDSSQRSAFDVERQIYLRGQSSGFDAYIGSRVSGGGAFDAGTVVFAIGRLAAVGPSRAPDGGGRQTSYFLSLDGGDIQEVDEFANATIRKKAAELRRAPRSG